MIEPRTWAQWLYSSHLVERYVLRILPLLFFLLSLHHFSTTHSLPTEIISEIFSNLPPADLLNKSYLSHRFRALSQPLLYSAPNLYSLQKIVIDRPETAFENFLHTILSPGGAVLASCVHRLFLQWGSRVVNDREFDYPHRFLTDTATLGPSPSHLELRRMAPNSQVLLLLSRLPNLRVVNFELVPPSAAPGVRAVGSLSSWAHLRSLRCALGHLADLVDVLPIGLCTLEVLHDPYKRGLPRERLITLVTLLQRNSALSPVLRRLVVDVHPGKERDAILQACVRARITFHSWAFARDGCSYDVPV